MLVNFSNGCYAIINELGCFANIDFQHLEFNVFQKKSPEKKQDGFSTICGPQILMKYQRINASNANSI